MKKFLISALLLYLSLTLISCDGNDNNKGVSSAEQKTSHSEENDSISDTDTIEEEKSKKSEAGQDKGNITSGDGEDDYVNKSDSSDKKPEILENENQSEDNELSIPGEIKDVAEPVTTKSADKTKNETSENTTKPIDSTAVTTNQNADDKNVTGTTDAKSSDVIELPFIPIEDLQWLKIHIK